MLTVGGLHLHTLPGLIPEVRVGHLVEDKKLNSLPQPVSPMRSHYFIRHPDLHQELLHQESLIMLEATGYHRQTQKAEESSASFSSRESPLG